MTLLELRDEIEAVKDRMMSVESSTIEFSELTVALVALQDTYIKQAGQILTLNGLLQ